MAAEGGSRGQRQGEKNNPFIPPQQHSSKSSRNDPAISLSKLRLCVAEENRLVAEQWTETEQLVDVVLELVLDSKRRK